jgi:hypothetical protein
MFCPACRSEFVEGLTVCPECQVKLIAELPPEPDPEYVEFVEVLGTYNQADIALLKSILDSEDITYFIKGENFQHVRPWADPARLMVQRDQVETVQELLTEVKLSYTGINLDRGSKKK